MIHKEVDLSKYSSFTLPRQNVDEKRNGGLLRVYPDLADLPFLHEAAVLYNIKKRYAENAPYTRAGDVVLDVNPFRWFHELFTEEVRAEYTNKLVWEDHHREVQDARTLVEPHVYEVSALSYKGLAFGGTDQSILVCGESGSGKTETIKLVIHHIASIQRGVTSSTEDSSRSDSFVNRILETGPLLEAFGNAKTKQNDNSSRFGNYTRLQFDRGDGKDDTATCKLAGSKVEVYMLGKNRITQHDAAAEERTYHIFYQLLAAPDAQKVGFWSGMKGTTNESFRCVGFACTDTIDGVSDKDRWNQTVERLKNIGVTCDELHTLFEAICVVLQLGNLSFAEDPTNSDASVVHNKAELDALGNLMGVTEQDLLGCVTERTLRCRADTFKVPLTADLAKVTADSFAREIYSKTFLWLVRSINDATCAEKNYRGGGVGPSDFGIIGLLDLVGFESLERNGFEQLCINYSNERLQAKFNSDIFGIVLEEYEHQGIPLDGIKYEDNADVLDLIACKYGLLTLLNEECYRPRGSDYTWIIMAKELLCKKSPCLFASQTSRTDFGIHHYAGKVVYDSGGFCFSNMGRPLYMGTLPTDLLDCAQKCKNEIISNHLMNEKCSDLAEEEIASKRHGPTRNRRRQLLPQTVWTKYKHQLVKLMDNLGQTNSRYIRCIKPNTQGAPGTMQHMCTIEQLRSAGAVAAATLSRATFSDCMENETVKSKFSLLWDGCPSQRNADSTCPAEKLRCDCNALLAHALRSFGGERPVQSSFAVGKTKSYFQTGALQHLEALRTKELESRAALTIQRFFCGWFVRKEGWVLIN